MTVTWANINPFKTTAAAPATTVTISTLDVSLAPATLASSTVGNYVLVTAGANSITLPTTTRGGFIVLVNQTSNSITVTGQTAPLAANSSAVYLNSDSVNWVAL